MTSEAGRAKSTGIPKLGGRLTLPESPSNFEAEEAALWSEKRETATHFASIARDRDSCVQCSKLVLAIDWIVFQKLEIVLLQGATLIPHIFDFSHSCTFYTHLVFVIFVHSIVLSLDNLISKVQKFTTKLLLGKTV